MRSSESRPALYPHQQFDSMKIQRGLSEWGGGYKQAPFDERVRRSLTSQIPPLPSSSAPPAPSSSLPPLLRIAVPRYTTPPVMCRAPSCGKLFSTIEMMNKHWREHHSKNPPGRERPDPRKASDPSPKSEAWEVRRGAAFVDLRPIPTLRYTNFVTPMNDPDDSPNSFRSEKAFSRSVRDEPPPDPFPSPRTQQPRQRSVRDPIPGLARSRSQGPVQPSRERERERDRHDQRGRERHDQRKRERHDLASSMSGPLSLPQPARAAQDPFPGSFHPPRQHRASGSELSHPQYRSSGSVRFESSSGPLPSPKHSLDRAGALSGPLPGPERRHGIVKPPSRALSHGSRSGDGGGPSEHRFSGSSMRRESNDWGGEHLGGNAKSSGSPRTVLRRESEGQMVRINGSIVQRGALGWPIGRHQGEMSPVSERIVRPSSRDRELERMARAEAEERLRERNKRNNGSESPPQADSSVIRGASSKSVGPAPGKDSFMRRLGMRSYPPRSAVRATEGLEELGNGGRGDKGRRRYWLWSGPKSFLAAARMRLNGGLRRQNGEEREEGRQRRKSSSSGRGGASPDVSQTHSQSWRFFSQGSPALFFSRGSSAASSGPATEWPGVPRDGSPGSSRRELAERSAPAGPTSDSEGWGSIASGTSGSRTPVGTPQVTPRKGIGTKLVQALKYNSSEFSKGKFHDDAVRASWEGPISSSGNSSFGGSGELPFQCDAAAADCKMRFSTSEELELHRRIHHSVVPLWVRGNSREPLNLGALLGNGWLNGQNLSSIGVFELALDIRNTDTSVASFESYRNTVMENTNTKTGKFWKAPAQISAAKAKQSGTEIQDVTCQRFYGTSLKCSLGINDRCRLCDSDRCELCCILRSGFKFKRPKANSRFGWGIHTSATMNSAHESYEAMEEDQTSTKRAAILVCQVVAGRVCHLPNAHVVGPPQGYDSVSIRTGAAGDSSDKDELIVFDKRALLPMYAIVYTPSD